MKHPYVILNLDDSTYWWVDDAKSQEEAIQDYCNNCHQDVEKTKKIELQAVALKPKKSFEIFNVTVTPTIKVTVERE